MWSGEIFLRNFFPHPPPNIPGLKGGDAFGTFRVIAIQNGSSELSVHFDGAGSHKTGVAVLGRGIFL